MCFSSAAPPATQEPAAAPPPPAIPTSQSASAAAPTLGAEPVQQIGFARKKENKARFGKTSGPAGRRDAATTTTGDTGSGIKM